MKLPAPVWFMLLALVPAAAVERLPVELFARSPDLARARLSPDGKRMAFLRDAGTRTTVHVLDIDQNKLFRLDQDEAVLANGARKEVESFTWVGDNRLVMTTTVWDSIYGVVAANWDGSRPVPISGFEDNKISLNDTKTFVRTVVHVFHDKDMSILMLDDHLGGPGRPDRPDVVRVDTLSGQLTLEEKTPARSSAGASISTGWCGSAFWCTASRPAPSTGRTPRPRGARSCRWRAAAGKCARWALTRPTTG